MQQWIAPFRRGTRDSELGTRLMTIQVTLLSHSPDPIRSLYMAYRTCYSQFTPQQVLARIEDERITDAQMRAVHRGAVKDGSRQPARAGVVRVRDLGCCGRSATSSCGWASPSSSRAGRYVTYKEGEFPYTVPETVKKAGMEGKMADLFDQVGALYEEMVAGPACPPRTRASCCPTRRTRTSKSRSTSSRCCTSAT